MSTEVPDGYERHARRSPLTDPWEPLYARKRDDSVSIAVEVREPHCNSRGIAHGGLISALADNAMGLSAVARAAREGRSPQGIVTVTLALDFIDSAKLGEWLEIVPLVLRSGGTLAFVECHVVCGERLVARGNATFRMQ